MNKKLGACCLSVMLAFSASVRADVVDDCINNSDKSDEAYSRCWLDEAKRLSAEIKDKYEQLTEDIELLDGAAHEFNLEEVRAGKLTPVFFGSALTNFGVETFLQHFLQMTTSPLPRMSKGTIVDPVENDFSAFVFKRNLLLRKP